MNNGDDIASTGPKIGRTLETARKERGISHKQAEQATKIRARYLRELERENFDVLPAVYVQGSLKTYANFLGLDGDALAAELRRQQDVRDLALTEPLAGGSSDHPSLAPGGASREATEEVAAPTPDRLLYLLLGAFIILVAFAAFSFDDGQPAVSHVHKPMISQAPAASVTGGEHEESPRPEENARPSKKDDEERGQNLHDERPVRVSRDTPAEPSAAAEPAPPERPARRHREPPVIGNSAPERDGVPATKERTSGRRIVVSAGSPSGGVRISMPGPRGNGFEVRRSKAGGAKVRIVGRAFTGQDGARHR